MISVLIPIFNYDVTGLVKSLITQLSLIEIDFEIICIDDASTDKSKNNNLNKIKNVRLHRLQANIGRSKIRNLLADKAKYDWLLFLDADVIPKHNKFILNYVSCLKSHKAKVFCGGIAYKKERPTSTKILRWQYGKKREEISAVIRDKKPYRYFFGANFLIHKSVFSICKFDETLFKYGYEDVLFMEQLKNNRVKIVHTDNDVYHLGIEENDIFIAKTKQAIGNLYQLTCQDRIKGDNLNILKWYKTLETYKLKDIFGKLYRLFNTVLERNLKSKIPSLLVFDLYKLIYFCYLSDKKTISNL
jgi:glycosyltransferase involved in cell wall biosynthesis